MATCGYLCPACEGRGYDECGNSCGWCSVETVKTKIVREGKDFSSGKEIESGVEIEKPEK
jgi:hypothetical protein